MRHRPVASTQGASARQKLHKSSSWRRLPPAQSEDTGKAGRYQQDGCGLGNDRGGAGSSYRKSVVVFEDGIRPGNGRESTLELNRSIALRSTNRLPRAHEDRAAAVLGASASALNRERITSGGT